MCILLQIIIIHLHCVHYSVHHKKCMEESEAPAKDLKLLQKEHQESVQESEEGNTKVIHCINLDVL